MRYITAGSVGITRKAFRGKFRYFGPDGKVVQDKLILLRIQALVIPPAWRDVWICPLEKGHLQAVGYDARGRKQYRYHALYRDIRNQTKFSRLTAFARALPRIRAQVEQDLQTRGLTKQRVIAALVSLLEATAIRVGNDEYAKNNESYGLTTMRDDHVDVKQDSIRFQFRGKSGQYHEIELRDKRLARIVKQCQDVPGYELFQYLDSDGEPCRVTSCDVNEYLFQAAGEHFTAKDFRTWAGTGHTILALHRMGAAETDTQCKKNLVEAVKEAAAKLGNKPATCRNYYVHPVVFDAYAEGQLSTFMQMKPRLAESASHALTSEELCVLELIENYSAQAKSSESTLQRFFGPKRKKTSAA